MQGMRSNISFSNDIFAVHIADFIPIYAICLWSDLVNLEQVRNHCDCLEKVSVQFLPTDTNWKGETLNKNLFILDLGQISVQFQPTTAEFYFYLVLEVSLIGSHGLTSVLICVYWCKSGSET